MPASPQGSAATSGDVGPAAAKPGLSPLLIIFFTVTLDLVGFGIVIPLLPLYAKSLGATAALVGVLFASYSLMQFIFAPVWGRVSDRIGRRPVLLTSMTVSVLAFIAFALAQSYWWLLAARVAAGMGTANLSVATAYIADVTRPEERARGMGMVGAAFGIGFVLGPWLGGELGRFGFAPPLFAAAGLALVNLGLAASFLPESLPPERRGVTHGRGLKARFSLLGRIEHLPRVVSLVFVNTAGFSMLEMAFVLFAAKRLGFDVEHSGRIFAYVGVIGAVIQGGLIGKLVRAFGEKRLVRTGMALMAAGLFLVPFTPPGRWLVLVAIMTLVAAGSSLTNPSLQSLVSRTASGDEQGLALGLAQSFSALARVVGPLIAGLLYDWGSEDTPFFAGGALMFAGFVAAFTLLAPLRAGSAPTAHA